MKDPEMAAAIVAGEPAGLAAAYDRYGAGLHAYCRMKLTEPADAEGAVQETFIAAAARLGKLRDRGELRPWLYAVARKECARRKRAGTVTLDALIGTGGTAAKATPQALDLGAAAGQAGLRRLAEVALNEMSPENREVLELGIFHGLHGPALARVLAVSPGDVDSMTSRAHAQFEELLGRLLVVRTGRATCPELSARLAGEHIDPAAVDEHIRQCTVCDSRAHTGPSPAVLLALIPRAEPAAGLRARTLSLAGDAGRAAIAYRAEVARRAGPFDADGFPGRRARRGEGFGPGRRTLVAAAALVAAVVLGGGALLVTGKPGNRGPAPSGLGGAAATPTSPTAGSSQLAPQPSRPDSSPAPAPSATTAHILAPITQTVSASRPPAAPSRSPSPAAGTLVAPGTVTLTLQRNNSYAGTFTLAARGGPVAKFAIRVTAPAVRKLAVDHPSGQLAAGQSVTETVTAAADRHGHAPEYLTLAPGGLTITVIYA